MYEDKERNEMRYDINFIDLEAKAPQCKMLILCNPHNPTGRIWTEAETKRVMAICEKHSLFVISDEILSDFMGEGTLPRFYSLANSTYPRLIVGIGSFTQPTVSAKHSTCSPSGAATLSSATQHSETPSLNYWARLTCMSVSCPS